MLELTQRQAVAHRRLTSRVAIQEDMRGIEKFRVAQAPLRAYRHVGARRLDSDDRNPRVQATLSDQFKRAKSATLTGEEKKGFFFEVVQNHCP
jgi:hypothetical protein